VHVCIGSWFVHTHTGTHTHTLSLYHAYVRHVLCPCVSHTWVCMCVTWLIRLDSFTGHTSHVWRMTYIIYIKIIYIDTLHIKCYHRLYTVTCHMWHDLCIVISALWHVTCKTWHVIIVSESTLYMCIYIYIHIYIRVYIYTYISVWSLHCDLCIVISALWSLHCDMWHVTCDMLS